MKQREANSTIRGQHHAIRNGVATVLCLLIAIVSGCSTVPPRPTSLPVLHAPGLVRLEAFTQVEAATNNHSVNSLLAYSPADGSGSSHLLILQQNGALYDAALDASGTIRPIQSPTCYRLGGVDPKSGETLCQGKLDTPGIVAFHPDDTSSVWSGRLLLSRTATDEGYSSPTWRPDGGVFAVVHSKGDTFDIALYAIDATMTTVHRVATLLLPHIPQLIIQWLSWSSDGAWLAFAGGVGHLDTTYGLPVATLLAQIPASSRKEQQITVNPDQLVTLVNSPIVGQAWRPTGSNLVYFDGEHLIEWNVLTQQHRVLLTIPDGNLCGLTWTPDGRRLIFAHCRYVPTEIAPPPAQIYLYTLPAT